MDSTSRGVHHHILTHYRTLLHTTEFSYVLMLLHDHGLLLYGHATELSHIVHLHLCVLERDREGRDGGREEGREVMRDIDEETGMRD